MFVFIEGNFWKGTRRWSGDFTKEAQSQRSAMMNDHVTKPQQYHHANGVTTVKAWPDPLLLLCALTGVCRLELQMRRFPEAAPPALLAFQLHRNLAIPKQHLQIHNDFKIIRKLVSDKLRSTEPITILI